MNPAHSILKNLLKLEPGSELQTLVIEQIFDSALLIEGLHPDPPAWFHASSRSSRRRWSMRNNRRVKRNKELLAFKISPKRPIRINALGNCNRD